MRTRRLCGLTLVVLLAHALAWRLAAGDARPPAPVRAGSAHVVQVSVPPRARVPSTDAVAAATAPRVALAPALAGALPAPGGMRAPSPGRGTPAGTDAPALRALAAAGAGGASRRAGATATPWPVYATRPPPSATLRYALVQTGPKGALAGDAELAWRRDAQAFSLRLATAVDGKPPREWQSTGAFDAAGVAPQRLVERERGRDKRELAFDRVDGRVRFSGAAGTPAVAPGVQDRWSWIPQLAAIAEAAAARGERPARWELQVAGLRGDLERWTFRVLPGAAPPPELAAAAQGNDSSSGDERAPGLLHVLRATDQPYDLRIEAWLSPALHHLPAGVRMSTPPSAWSLSLWLAGS